MSYKGMDNGKDTTNDKGHSLFTSLKVTKITVTDESGNNYEIELNAEYMAKTASDDIRSAAYLMAAVFAGGGWEALIRYINAKKISDLQL